MRNGGDWDRQYSCHRTGGLAAEERSVRTLQRQVSVTLAWFSSSGGRRVCGCIVGGVDDLAS